MSDLSTFHVGETRDALLDPAPPSIAHVFGAPVPLQVLETGIGSVADVHEDRDLLL